MCFVPVNAAKIRTISNRKTCACADKSCAITGRVRAELRLLVLALMFLSGFVLLGARMGLLAATEPVEMRVGLVEGISDTRSDITDRNGRVLATNLATHALYAETRRMVDPVRAARELGRIFPELDAGPPGGALHRPGPQFCLGAHPPFARAETGGA